LDFTDPAHTNERGAPLVDVPDLVSDPLEEEEEQEDPSADPDLTAETTERHYWAGDLGEQDSPRDLQGNYSWQMKPNPGNDADAEQAASSWFQKIGVGDWFAIKKYGGANDLQICYVGEITEIDVEDKRLELKRLDIPLYRGKAPRRARVGSWSDSLIAVMRRDAIDLLFGVKAESSSLARSGTKALTIARNLILHGPPGTGKTYRLKTEYEPHFTRGQADDHRGDKQTLEQEDLENFLRDVPWWHVAMIALHDMGGRAKLKELVEHRFAKAKYAASDVRSPLLNFMATALQVHAIKESEYVARKTRRGEAVFDRDEDKNWFFPNGTPATAMELLEELQTITGQPIAPTNVTQDFTFVTFHQSYAYEDFLEGLRPRVDDGSSGGTLGYSLEDGIFKKAVRSALRIAGVTETIDQFCRLSRAERFSALEGAPPYGLFIDEINRGNVSGIFGELITLLEEDKRLGELNEIIVTLPYSKSLFGIPSNLYVIGTMNTADRSVEKLDSALRRRFSFVECVPDIRCLDLEIPGGVHIGRLLQTINRRLAKLLGHDHVIGHAYFLPLKEGGGLDLLKVIFSTKIIPLLQEYFFGDWGQIGLVLGEDFVRRIDAEIVFADFAHEAAEELAERPVYELSPPESWTNRSFRRIYGDATEND
jgi:5-methylcytosine-specific restriction protein B